MKTPTDPAPSSFLPLTPAAFHVLVALAGGELHGYAILKEVEGRTGGAVRLSTGTLYGLVQRFLEAGLIAEAGADERRRSYRLTRLGRQVASAEAERLETLVEAARAQRLLPRRRPV
ncbi:MAG TPA: helix-turn-helix transcriptional regulator [Thermoanaerobaculia bacterium]|nr:helix-turn-helix transcriptional regulator [Thermoanaerobaculia bacterium]